MLTIQLYDHDDVTVKTDFSIVGRLKYMGLLLFPM